VPHPKIMGALLPNHGRLLKRGRLTSLSVRPAGSSLQSDSERRQKW